MPTTFYSPLISSIAICAIDDEQHQRELYAQIIGGHPLFSIETVDCASKAEKSIQSKRCPNLCIIDLGIDDIKNDEFYLIKKYARKVPFIVISGAGDMERAFNVSNLGASALIEKPVNYLSIDFWGKLGEIILERVVLPYVPSTTNPAFSQCCQVLKTQQISSVTEWAYGAGISEAYLRRLWTESNLGSPRHFLFIYQYYKEALDYYNAEYLYELTDSSKPPRTPDLKEHRKKTEYFVRNQQLSA